MNPETNAENLLDVTPTFQSASTPVGKPALRRWRGGPLRALWCWLLEASFSRPPRFSKYRPAARHGTRRVEDRLLRRFNPAMVETSQ